MQISPLLLKPEDSVSLKSYVDYRPLPLKHEDSVYLKSYVVAIIMYPRIFPALAEIMKLYIVDDLERECDAPQRRMSHLTVKQ